MVILRSDMAIKTCDHDPAGGAHGARGTADAFSVRLTAAIQQRAKDDSTRVRRMKVMAHDDLSSRNAVENGPEAPFLSGNAVGQYS